MEELVPVKTYLPAALARHLDEECRLCGCAKSAVLRDAVAKKVLEMAKLRRTRELTMVLPEQAEMEVK